jgi:hypothetical protein
MQFIPSSSTKAAALVTRRALLLRLFIHPPDPETIVQKAPEKTIRNGRDRHIYCTEKKARLAFRPRFNNYRFAGGAG